MEDLIRYFACKLVDYPDQVFVDKIDKGNTLVFELRVAKEDLGKIIGKQGRTARAMRTILNAVSTKIGKRTSLEILE